MQDVRRRRVVVLVTRSLCPKAKVQVLAVHEVVFVKALQRLVQVSLDAEKRATDGVHFGNRIGVSIRHVVAGQKFALREHRGKADRLGNCRNNRRERPTASPLERPVLVQDAATHRTRFRMFFHEIEHLGERIARNDRIGIDKEQERLGRMLFGKVTALTKTQVFRGIEPQDLGEKLLDFRRDAILRPVVQNDNLGINSFTCVTNGLQACRNEVAGIVGNDDDGTRIHSSLV